MNTLLSRAVHGCLWPDECQKSAVDDSAQQLASHLAICYLRLDRRGRQVGSDRIKRIAQLSELFRA
jgi:hypothetical protein